MHRIQKFWIDASVELEREMFHISLSSYVLTRLDAILGMEENYTAAILSGVA